MDYDAIFNAYYTQYRAEATIPSTTDDEYIIGLRLANEGLNYWANYDATYWKELFTTAQTNSTGGVVSLSTGVKTYLAPTAMRESGGYIKFLNGTTTQSHIPIIEPQDAQFRDPNSRFAYFTGDPNNGYTLNLNVAPVASENGFLVDYVYYKKPTQYTAGTSKSEIPNPYFIVHRMLASRFRSSRNPYYSSAKSDAENAMRIMQLDNNSGNWSNPWKLADNSGSVWGRGSGTGW